MYALHFVFSAYDYIIPAYGKVVALTDLQIALPSGCYGRIGKNCLTFNISSCCRLWPLKTIFLNFYVQAC